MQTHAVAFAELHSLGEDDACRVGRKAATLGHLARAGVAVPEGVVLGAEVLDLVLSGVGGASLRLTAERLRDLSLPPQVETAIDAIAVRFGDETLAVRSSAATEDLPEASFAGQYESVLGVRGPEALKSAVRHCWESAYGTRVRTYASGLAPTPPAEIDVSAPTRRGERPRRQSQRAEPSGFAVLVQRQVDADVAGVAFTADPLTGATDRVLVSAAPGTADGVVAGEVTPDEWVVTHEAATAATARHQALTEPQARAVAALARRVETILGVPQDVEWAMADGRLLVLQARPVTALPTPPVADLPPGTWVKESGRYPEPLTAFGASRAGAAVADGLTSMLKDYGSLVESIETRTIGGEAYTHAVPVGGRDGPPPPWWALGVLVRVHPALRRRVRRAGQMSRPERLEHQIERWEHDWRPTLQSQVADLRATDLAELDDAEVAAHLQATVDLLLHALHLHFALIPPYAVPVVDLVRTCARLLGWEERQALDLLAGASPTSSSQSRALADLAARVRRRPRALAVVLQGKPGLAEALAEVDSELGASFVTWCEEYGFRCVHDDPGSPTLLERPALLERLLREAVRHRAGRDEAVALRAGEAAARARSVLAGHRARERADFERALSAATRSYALREDTAFWAASVPAALVRRAVVEAGRRLAGAGVIARVEDVVHLDADSVLTAVAHHGGADLRALVRHNRSERDWVRLHPGPAFYGPPPQAPPDLRGLPAAARRLNEALLWTQRSGEAPDLPASPDADALVGVAASAGRHTGPVRVVADVADFSRVRHGDVLVSRTTDPAWSVLFGIAGALVTDGGGILCHAAIVAREHALPAVVGTGHATTILRDGDPVTVDGTTGRVEIDRTGATGAHHLLYSHQEPS